MSSWLNLGAKAPTTSARLCGRYKSWQTQLLHRHAAQKNEGSRQLKDLVNRADVFTQGYRPGAMEKHGIWSEGFESNSTGSYLSLDQLLWL